MIGFLIGLCFTAYWLIDYREFYIDSLLLRDDDIKGSVGVYIHHALSITSLWLFINGTIPF